MGHLSSKWRFDPPSQQMLIPSLVLIIVSTWFWSPPFITIDKKSRKSLYSSNLFILYLGADDKIIVYNLLLFLLVYAPNSLFSIPGLAFPSSSIFNDRSAMFFIIWEFSSSWVGPTSFRWDLEARSAFATSSFLSDFIWVSILIYKCFIYKP